MKTFQFKARPRWSKTNSESVTIISAETEKQARAIARLEWAMQGRLPNNTQIVEL